MMSTSIGPRDSELAKGIVVCAACAMEVPLDEAVVPEVTDRLIYLCGLECYARWRGAAAGSYPSQSA
jgi:hypothetical protein